MGCTGIRPLSSLGTVAAVVLAGFVAFAPSNAAAQEGQLADLYSGCSPAYEMARRQVYESLLERARSHQERAAAANVAQRFDDMLAEYAQAMGYLRRVGMLPPESLPDPCPPAREPPPFKIPGTEIAVYDIDLAEKWGRRLEALQQNACSNRHPPLLRQAKEDADSDRAARERAAEEMRDREARARLASDARALGQLEPLFPEHPCSDVPGRRIGAAPAGGGRFDSLDYEHVGPLGPGEFQIPGTNTILRIGGGARVVDEVDTSNGGLGGTDTVPAFELSTELKVDRERIRQLFGPTPLSGMSFRLFGSLGGSENGLNGAGNIMLQPNGGTQDVSGAGSVSGGEAEVDHSRFGFETRFYGPEHPLGPGVVTPFLGLGFEHRRLETELTAQWTPINFIIVDSREVQTNRLSAQGGLAFSVPLSPDMYLVLQGLLQLNADIARARGRYFTEQTAVFSETVTGRASDTSIMLSGELSATGVRTFASGVQLELRGWVGFDQLQQAEYHQGMPMTIDNRGVVDYGVDLRLVIPLPN